MFRSIIVILMTVTPILVNAQPYLGQPTELYCEGQTFELLGQAQRSDTTAYLRIGEAETYVEINGVGGGLVSEGLRMITSMQAHGLVSLISVVQPESLSDGEAIKIEAQISIDKYSGSIAVFATEQGNTKTLFQGVCRKAEALF
jgi:hypothetical protein